MTSVGTDFDVADIESDQRTVVVVGAGQAGGETVIALRSQGFAGHIVLVGNEARLPYSRPPLSKQFLKGTLPAERMLLRPASFYQKHNITVLTERSVTRVHRAARTLEMSDGTTLGYSHLVIATGGSPRKLPENDRGRPTNLHYIRTVNDVDALRADLVEGARLIVIGGGYIGLEIAAVAQEQCAAVTVIESADRLLARVAGVELAQFVHTAHARRGVTLRVGTSVTAFHHDAAGRVTEVVLSSGETLPADVVVVGIGLIPNVGLAVECGLEVDNGVVVDEYCCTVDPNVYAVGDCARHPCSEHGGLRRLESVANATEQARTAAAAIVGRKVPYQAVPWFWSDQADVKLQSVGLTIGADEVVVRPQSEEGQFAVFYLKGGQLRAADIINNPRLFALTKKLVAARTAVSPAQLGDPNVPLDVFL